jgi:hypothetical protein
MTDLFVKGVGKVLVEICEGVYTYRPWPKTPMPSPMFLWVLARPQQKTTNKAFQSLAWQRIFHPILSVCHKITLCLVLPTVMFPFAFDCHRFFVSTFKPSFKFPFKTVCNTPRKPLQLSPVH